jgi:hypothetical protein
MIPADKFKEIIKAIIISRDIKLSSFGQGRIKEIENKIKAKKITTEEIVEKLYSEKEFMLKLKNNDWIELRNKIKNLL